MEFVVNKHFVERTCIQWGTGGSHLLMTIQISYTWGQTSVCNASHGWSSQGGYLQVEPRNGADVSNWMFKHRLLVNVPSTSWSFLLNWQLMYVYRNMCRSIPAQVTNQLWFPGCSCLNCKCTPLGTYWTWLVLTCCADAPCMIMTLNPLLVEKSHWLWHCNSMQRMLFCTWSSA